MEGWRGRDGWREGGEGWREGGVYALVLNLKTNSPVGHSPPQLMQVSISSPRINPPGHSSTHTPRSRRCTWPGTGMLSSRCSKSPAIRIINNLSRHQRVQLLIRVMNKIDK
jgi:hypothetical protein